jgi:hypothetical protein
MVWPSEEQIGDKQLRTVILRLVLDRWGALLHGEVTDVDGERVYRFARWEEILASIQAAVAGAKRAP